MYFPWRSGAKSCLVQEVQQIELDDVCVICRKGHQALHLVNMDQTPTINTCICVWSAYDPPLWPFIKSKADANAQLHLHLHNIMVIKMHKNTNTSINVNDLCCAAADVVSVFVCVNSQLVNDHVSEWQTVVLSVLFTSWMNVPCLYFKKCTLAWIWGR